MKTTTKKTGLKVTTGVKAGGFDPKFNHSSKGLAVKTALKAGFNCMKNHAVRLLVVS